MLSAVSCMMVSGNACAVGRHCNISGWRAVRNDVSDLVYYAGQSTHQRLQVMHRQTALCVQIHCLQLKRKGENNLAVI